MKVRTKVDKIEFDGSWLLVNTDPTTDTGIDLRLVVTDKVTTSLSIDDLEVIINHEWISMRLAWFHRDISFFAQIVKPICTIPPAGWYCTRNKGHDGPCAAREIST